MGRVSRPGPGIVFKRLFALVLALVVLGACETTPPRAFPDLTFGHKGVIGLKVGRVEITTRYIPPLKDPYVEHRAPVTPYSSMRRWAEQRLKARGGPNVAHFTILDASIRAVPLKTTGGVKGIFLRERSVRYEGRGAVLLEIRDPRGRQLAFMTARAKYDGTTVEGASLAEREKMWFDIVEAIMKELDKQLQSGTEQYLGPHRATR